MPALERVASAKPPQLKSPSAHHATSKAMLLISAMLRQTSTVRTEREGAPKKKTARRGPQHLRISAGLTKQTPVSSPGCPRQHHKTYMSDCHKYCRTRNMNKRKGRHRPRSTWRSVIPEHLSCPCPSSLDLPGGEQESLRYRRRWFLQHTLQ